MATLKKMTEFFKIQFLVMATLKKMTEFSIIQFLAMANFFFKVAFLIKVNVAIRRINSSYVDVTIARIYSRNVSYKIGIRHYDMFS